METPKTKSGQITEAIMAIFWRGDKTLNLEITTAQYNRIYSHVLYTLEKELH